MLKMFVHAACSHEISWWLIYVIKWFRHVFLMTKIIPENLWCDVSPQNRPPLFSWEKWRWEKRVFSWFGEWLESHWFEGWQLGQEWLIFRVGGWVGQFQERRVGVWSGMGGKRGREWKERVKKKEKKNLYIYIARDERETQNCLETDWFGHEDRKAF